jgi:alpha-L-fucosidase
MTMTRRDMGRALGAATLIASGARVSAQPRQLSPATDPDRLRAAQQRFLDLRFGMFIHLNMATFQEREWGDPKQPASLFAPLRLDTDQWARGAKSANMGYGCLTTKHHDGFCLWPTRTSSPSVAQAGVREDVVRRYVDSFRRAGLKVCLYFSILDLRADIRAHNVTPEKIAMIQAQITELLTGYGPITALILDGWDAAWSRIGYDEIPYRAIYDTVKTLQPDCLVTDHNAGRYPQSGLYYTDIKQYEQHAGQKIPADSPVPSQSGTTLQSDWFWKKSYPTAVLADPRAIVEEWLVPFNANRCNLILNVAPNRDGRFDDNAMTRLSQIGALWSNPGPVPRLAPSVLITTPNLARDQAAWASSSAETSGPDLAFDDSAKTFWEAESADTNATIEVTLPRPQPINTVAIVSPVETGERTAAAPARMRYSVEAEVEGQWKTIVDAHTLDRIALHRVARVTATRVRLILSGRTIRVGEVGVYDEP